MTTQAKSPGSQKQTEKRLAWDTHPHSANCGLVDKFMFGCWPVSPSLLRLSLRLVVHSVLGPLVAKP